VLAVIFLLVFLVAENLRREPPPVAKLDGSKAEPVELKSARAGAPVALINNNLEPLWKQTLFGTGNTRPLGFFQAEVYTGHGDVCTMIALADPDRDTFDFAIELNYMNASKTFLNDFGIFFGRRRNPADSDGHHRFFLLKLDQRQRKDAPHGVLAVGTGHLIDAKEGRPAGGTLFTEFADPKAALPLPNVPGWHKVRVQVRPDGFTVGLGVVLKRDFPMSWVREKDVHRVPGTDGAVGVWASQGRGFFRNAIVIYP